MADQWIISTHIQEPEAEPRQSPCHSNLTCQPPARASHKCSIHDRYLLGLCLMCPAPTVTNPPPSCSVTTLQLAVQIVEETSPPPILRGTTSEKTPTATVLLRIHSGGIKKEAKEPLCGQKSARSWHDTLRSLPVRSIDVQ